MALNIQKCYKLLWGTALKETNLYFVVLSFIFNTNFRNNENSNYNLFNYFDDTALLWMTESSRTDQALKIPKRSMQKAEKE